MEYPFWKNPLTTNGGSIPAGQFLINKTIAPSNPLLIFIVCGYAAGHFDFDLVNVIGNLRRKGWRDMTFFESHDA
jgi:hypothetical protein